MVNVKKLKSVMVLAGHSQASLAEALGISANTLNSKLQGRSKIYTDEAAKMCEILGIVSEKEKCDIFLS